MQHKYSTSRRLALSLAAAALSLTAAAQTPAPDLQAKLMQLYPKTNFTSVSTTPVAGVYEVVMGKTVSYVDATGRYFLFGNMFDMATRTDMTAPRIAEASRVDVSRLPALDAIRIVKGNGRRTLYVFSDPDCPACRSLEPTLDKLNDVTIHVYPFPLTSIHPNAARKATSIWCSPDKARAWTDWMISGKQPVPSECESPVSRNIALAQQLDINATPTLISADGRKQAGALGEAALNAFIDGPTAVSAR
jgi:thiol:disulfide interchange protein DsbC